MTNTIFISEDYLKENTIINGNVDMKYISVNLKMVEDVQIHQIIGSNLYNLLKTQVADNTVTEDNKILIEDYIQPCMIYWLLSELPVDMAFKWENKAIVKKSSENSQPVELNELKYIIDKKDKIARFYSQRLTDFLCANTNKYPEYLQSTTMDALHPVDSMVNYGGMYLGNNGRCKRDNYQR